MSANENALSATGKKREFAKRLMLSGLCTVATTAWAESAVTFIPQDLDNVSAGVDLWSFIYLVEGPVDTFQSVNLMFDPQSYGTELLVTEHDAAFAALVTPPRTIPDLVAGLVTATAFDPIAMGTSAQFTVQFTWLGTGAPGAQPFEVLDDQFNVIFTGNTVLSPIPEVSTAALLIAGLMLLPLLPRRRN